MAPTPAPTPKKLNPRLILILAALVGVILGGVIGIFAFVHKGPTTAANSPNLSPAGKIIGRVSFNSSGGLQGTTTITLPENTAAPASSIQKGASANVLQVVVNNGTLNFGLTLSPYPGPGSYTLQPFQTNPAPGSFNGTIRISNQQNSWSLHPPAQCAVTIASDTPLNLQAQKKPLHEVKGSFDCPKLVGSGTIAPIKVTQGQFDVYVEMLGS